MHEKRFFPKKEYMPADSIDEGIMDIVETANILSFSEADIDDDMRQEYVNVSYSLMFDAISCGEEFYVRNLNSRMIDYLNGE